MRGTATSGLSSTDGFLGADPRPDVTTLVDTNILLDIATNDPRWAPWSLQHLDAAAIRGPVLINAVVYAEFSIGYARIEEIDRVLTDVGLELAEIPRAALFLAGKVFQRYRAQGGSRTGVLPISSSGRTPPSRSFHCSHAIPAAIEHTFRASR